MSKSHVVQRPPDSFSGLVVLLLGLVVVVILYLGRALLAPLSLSVLLAFLLIPLVKTLERRLGRVSSVILVMTASVGLIIGGGWFLADQAVDLAKQLPYYKKNLSAKIQSIKPKESQSFSDVARTVEDLRQEITGEKDNTAAKPLVVTQENGRLGLIPKVLGPLSAPIGNLGMIILLSTFILLRMEDLQSRVVSLIGQGRISKTSRALDDASHRVRKYLMMQVVVNATYGLVLGLGLLAIGIPNAMLWGALSFVLRFIPYIGPWIAAAFPLALSLAISPDWTLPLMTLVLFVVIELLSNNVMEPMLYGSSTGVSSFALIVAAIFWTWLWGPIGLVLATPLTVILVVMGKNIPGLAFLSVLLSEQQALSASDDLYLRLLRSGDHSEEEIIEEYLEQHPPTTLFDDMLMPLLGRLEDDLAAGILTTSQVGDVHEDLIELLEEVEPGGPRHEIANPDDKIKIWCLPVRKARDVMTGHFLQTAFESVGFVAHAMKSRGTGLERLRSLEENSGDKPDVIVVSAMYPTGFTQARSLIQKIQREWAESVILLCIWGLPKDKFPDADTIQASGVEGVVSTVSEAVAFLEGFTAQVSETTKPPPVPIDEVDRLRTLHRLALVEGLGDQYNSELKRLASKLSMPSAMFTIVDEDSQIFFASSGLPESLAALRKGTRDESICGHVVGNNRRELIEDTLKDRRFAGNSFVRQHCVRFYAGVPVLASNGQPIGSVCVMDTKPRRISRVDMKQLDQLAKSLSARIAAMKPADPDQSDAEAAPATPEAVIKI